LVAAHGESDGFAAVLLQNIGSIHRRARRYRQARDAYERALPLLKGHFGERDPHVATALSNLGVVYCSLGDYAQAFEKARRGLEIDTSVSGPDHPDVGIALLNLARISDTVGDRRAALEQVDRAIEIFGRRFPPGHPMRIRAANFKAGFLIELRRLAEARNTLENLAAREGVSVEAKLALLNGRVILADIERLERRLPKSEELARNVLADPAVRGDRRGEADARWAHAYALAMQAKMEEAGAERARALAIESALAQGVAFPTVFADAKYHLCAGDAARAIAILSEAVAKGFHDPIVLNDPTFAVLRENPDFAPIAAAVAPRVLPPMPTRQ
ncbi:MAG: tetratricopeptide repeat protein, partial [Bryobacteraceae bacterium]